MNLETFPQELLGHEKFHLERVENALSSFTQIINPLKLAFQDIGTKVFIVGGTNGKGETSLALESLFLENGVEEVALWTSPHIMTIRERFRFAGKLIPARELEKEFSHSQKELGLAVQGLSYYEYLFWVFCTWSLSKRPKILILEVGLGGRLDATNLFDPDFSAITSLSRDHQEILGPTLKAILGEKLGISRPKVPLLTALESRYLQQKAHNYCLEREIPHLDLFSFGKLGPGDDFSTRNKVLAQALFESWNRKGSTFFDPPYLEKLKKLKKTKDPYSLKSNLYKKGNVFIHLYGSHNVDGLRKLMDLIDFQKIQFNKTLISFSKRSKKDILSCLKILRANQNKVGIPCLSFFNHPKGCPREMIEEVNLELGLNYVESSESFISSCAGDNDKILITGSYYFIGQVEIYLCQLGFQKLP